MHAGLSGSSVGLTQAVRNYYAPQQDKKGVVPLVAGLFCSSLDHIEKGRAIMVRTGKER
jgi:hypothetical protein